MKFLHLTSYFLLLKGENNILIKSISLIKYKDVYEILTSYILFLISKRGIRYL